jgi:heterodisulfide reductase subunit B
MLVCLQKQRRIAMIKLGYFPGCSLHGTAIEYDESLNEIARIADLELAELDDWNCCGATAAHSMNSSLAGLSACKKFGSRRTSRI